MTPALERGFYGPQGAEMAGFIKEFAINTVFTGSIL